MPYIYDKQSKAFRELPLNEQIMDIELGAHAEIEHPPITDLEDLKLPEDYEDDNWDEGRETPKTVEEARGMLLERILNPNAPDGDEVIGAYDELEDD